MKKGADINQVVDKDGNNILGYLGANCNEGQLLSWYVDNKGDINFQNSRGETVFHQAFKNKNEWEYGWMGPKQISQVCGLLIEAGINLSLAAKDGNHAIHTLCKWSENEGLHPLELLAMILQAAPEERYALDGEEHSCAYICSAAGKMPLLKMILNEWDASKGSPGTPGKLIESICKAAASAGYSTKEQRKTLEEISMLAIELFLPYFGNDAEQRRQAFLCEEQGKTPLHALARSSPWLPEALVKAAIIKEEDLVILDSQGVSVVVLAAQTQLFCELHDACYSLNEEKMIDLLYNQFHTPENLPVSGDLILEAFLQGLAQKTHSEQKVPPEQQTRLLSKLLEFGLDPNCILSLKSF